MNIKAAVALSLALGASGCNNNGDNVEANPSIPSIPLPEFSETQNQEATRNLSNLNCILNETPELNQYFLSYIVPIIEENSGTTYETLINEHPAYTDRLLSEAFIEMHRRLINESSAINSVRSEELSARLGEVRSNVEVSMETLAGEGSEFRVYRIEDFMPDTGESVEIERETSLPTMGMSSEQVLELYKQHNDLESARGIASQYTVEQTCAEVRLAFILSLLDTRLSDPTD